MEWTTTLKCNTCGTEIRFENQRPEWKTDQALLSEYEAAQRFVVANAGQPIGNMQRPRFVSSVPKHTNGACFQFFAALEPKPDARYVDCPCCEGKARFGSGKQAKA